MTQKLRPIFDTFNTTWGFAPLYEKLDEDVADGPTTAISSSFVPSPSDYFEVKLTSGDPRVTRGQAHIIKFQAWEDLGSTDTEVQINVLTGSTNRLTENVVLTNGATPTTYQFTLDQTAANSINSYSDVRVQMRVSARSGAVTVKVSWIEFEIPDAEAPINPQLLRPVSDISNVSWTAEPLYEKLDETVADGTSTFVVSSGAPVSSFFFDVKLSSGTEPTISSRPHIIKFQAWDNSGRPDTTVRAHLYAGGLPIGSMDVELVHGSTPTIYEFKLFQTEINQITDLSDYTDLSVRIIPISGDASGRIAISWIEVEIPETEVPAPKPLRVLLNTGFNVLLNTGHDLLLNAVDRINAGRSDSHTTIDAGVDLREKKPKKRPKQRIHMTVSIPITGTVSSPQKSKTKITGTANVSQGAKLSITGTAKSTQKTVVPIKGTAKAKNRTVVPVQGKKGFNRIKEILKETLHLLDD